MTSPHPSPLRPDLRSVTLCAVDCASPALAAVALMRCAAQCDFGDVILLSHVAPSPLTPRIRHIPIRPLLSCDDYSRFMLRELVHHIATPHVLVVQWDGFVLDASAWADDFLAYDYIGAKWPWHAERRIGNGGFSLRSKRLLEAVATIAPDDLGRLGEDAIICQGLAGQLETSFGIRFAPEALADRFAYEHSVPDRPSFGFHGMFNLWRHVDDEALAVIVSMLVPATVRSLSFASCLLNCCRQRRFKAMRALYGRLRHDVGPESLRQHFAAVNLSFDLAQEIIMLCEPLVPADTQPHRVAAA